MEQKLNLKDYFELAKRNGIVHNQSQFAELLQTDASTMSICLKGGNKKYATTSETLISRAWIALMKAGIDIDHSDTIEPNNQTDNGDVNQTEDSVPILQHTVSMQQEIIRQQQEQINRLNREIDGLYERIDELKRATSIAAPHSVTAV